jgi:hypothetical protein
MFRIVMMIKGTSVINKANIESNTNDSKLYIGFELQVTWPLAMYSPLRIGLYNTRRPPMINMPIKIFLEFPLKDLSG